MADEQDRPDQARESGPPPAGPAIPENKPPAKKAAKAARKAPEKAAKKLPAKKAPAKAAKKAAKKAAPKKAPPKPAAPPPPPPPRAAEPLASTPPETGPGTAPEPAVANLADTNGEEGRTRAANEAAAQAKWSVQSAPDSLTGPVPLSASIVTARLSAAVALAIALLAILVIRRLRASGDSAGD